MAVLVTTCPHCGAREMTFRIFGVVPATAERAKAQGGLCTAAIAACCEACGDPISALLTSTHARDNYPDFPRRASKLVSEAGTPQDFDFEVANLWPEPQAPRVPEHLPEAVERAFLQGEKTYALAGCEDAAATMYRSALEKALKQLHPEGKGMLQKRIEVAVAEGLLPAIIGEWAEEVRIVGNESAHGLEGVTRADLEAARGFVDAVLRYLYSLPKMVEDRRFDRELSKVLG